MGGIFSSFTGINIYFHFFTEMEHFYFKGATSYLVKLVNQVTFDVKLASVDDESSVLIQRLDAGIIYRISIVAQVKEKDLISDKSYRIFQRTCKY